MRDLFLLYEELREEEEENEAIDVLELLPSLINSNYVRAGVWMKRWLFCLW